LFFLALVGCVVLPAQDPKALVSEAKLAGLPHRGIDHGAHLIVWTGRQLK
jgi:hypothetical protein